MRPLALLLIALATGISVAAMPAAALAASWGSAYGDPWGFCPAQSFLPSSYTAVVTNDPFVGSKPRAEPLGHPPRPGWDDWYS